MVKYGYEPCRTHVVLRVDCSGIIRSIMIADVLFPWRHKVISNLNIKINLPSESILDAFTIQCREMIKTELCLALFLNKFHDTILWNQRVISKLMQFVSSLLGFVMVNQGPIYPDSSLLFRYSSPRQHLSVQGLIQYKDGVLPVKEFPSWRSQDRLISSMGFDVLGRHLYIESGP